MQLFHQLEEKVAETFWPTFIAWLREAYKKKTGYFMTANFNCHLPTLPNYDINIYDKATKIEAPTHLQVITTNIKNNFSFCSFIFIIFNGKVNKWTL